MCHCRIVLMANVSAGLFVNTPVNSDTRLRALLFANERFSCNYYPIPVSQSSGPVHLLQNRQHFQSSFSPFITLCLLKSTKKVRSHK